MSTTDLRRWRQANRALIAKCLAELCYEQALTAEAESERCFVVALGNGVRYHFRAMPTVWDWLHIEPETLERGTADGREPAVDATQLLIDAAPDLELDDCTLGNLLHEIANTLAADTALLAARENLDAEALARLPDQQLQGLLDGHPKAVANKGRIGWGADEYAHFAPESNRTVRLHWLAVDRSLVASGCNDDWPHETLLRESLSEKQYAALMATCRDRNIDTHDYLVLPVHPWQWQRHVRHHYAGEIAAGRIHHLGAWGNHYRPLISLRTLANAERPEALHVKLPLTVLNTSCYRGIPGDYIASGPALSAWLRRLCETDDELMRRGTDVLQEVAGAHVTHRHHAQVAGTPYRYREMLGVTWRQSPVGRCGTDERPMLMAALLQTDAAGDSVAGALIRQSGLSDEAWLAHLFGAVVVPLYHLMCRYGVGLVAHAQNLTLVLHNAVPRRALLKDFQGDLRLVDRAFSEHADLPTDALTVLTRLPPDYLIHDLFTGHFVTVLRYLSACLRADRGLDEMRFYAVLARVLRNYQDAHPELAERFDLFDLFRERIERVCINRVRFRIGYEDNARRPVPMVGGDLNNPIRLAEQQQSVTEPVTEVAP